MRLADLLSTCSMEGEAVRRSVGFDCVCVYEAVMNVGYLLGGLKLLFSVGVVYKEAVVGISKVKLLKHK
jgi:hypothetical protein